MTTMRTILCPIDFSDQSRQALRRQKRNLHVCLSRMCVRFSFRQRLDQTGDSLRPAY
jgi:hypothetical protein